MLRQYVVDWTCIKTTGIKMMNVGEEDKEEHGEDEYEDEAEGYECESKKEEKENE